MSWPRVAFRPLTQDILAWNDVVEGNEYGLPDCFDMQADVILDVGAHIGCFAIACLQRRAHKVVCVEPDPDNCNLLRFNLQPYHDRAHVVQGAIWRNDRVEKIYLNTRPEVGGALTAMSHTLRPYGLSVEPIMLDQLLKMYGWVRLLKLDCEEIGRASCRERV